MRVIHLTRYAMLRKLWALAVILVFLCALPFVVWGAPQVPPGDLLAHVSSHKLVHDKRCNFREMRHVECLIFTDEARGIIWLVLFDKKKDELFITHVVGIVGRQERIVWCRQDVCI